MMNSAFSLTILKSIFSIKQSKNSGRLAVEKAQSIKTMRIQNIFHTALRSFLKYQRTGK